MTEVNHGNPECVCVGGGGRWHSPQQVTGVQGAPIGILYLRKGVINSLKFVVF
jgi:hypothetical protein